MKTEPQRNLQANFFADLAAQCPGTAAEKLPLIIWRDDVGKWLSSNVFQHLDFLSLYVVKQGSGTHIVDGHSYGVSRGDVYVMGVGSTHYYAECDKLVLDTLHFTPQIFDSQTLDHLAETPGFQPLFIETPTMLKLGAGQSRRWLHLSPTAYESVAGIIGEIKIEWQSGTPDGTLLTRSLFLQMLIKLARYYAESGKGNDRDLKSTPTEVTLAAAIQYMDERFTETLRVEQVAARVFLSPDRFTEVFATAMGCTPRDYLRHLRVERAKDLLTRTKKPISDVGFESGFGDAAYFTRAFRASVGQTPSDYRKSVIKNPASK